MNPSSSKDAPKNAFAGLNSNADTSWHDLLTSLKQYLEPSVESSRGSETFMIDVPKAISRPIPGGNSLQNYGNADAINNLVKGLINAGISPEDIVILTFYSAQVTLLRQVIEPFGDGRLRYSRICEVEDFGGEAPVVIVDFVVAENLGNVDRTSFAWADDEQPVHNHIRTRSNIPDWRRVNRALTRALDSLVLVGQLTFLISGVRPHRGRLANILFCLASDYERRGLISSSEDLLDSHPRAVALRQARDMTPEQIDQATADELRDRQAYITHKLEWGRNNISDFE
ncbi:MAG: hypothetical protein Q9220_006292 [cf. Caloplaca sp. 1 TL-2023]